MNAADPWVITSREKVKYEEQFKGLQPNNGIVTGAQAKGFFLQSQLPPAVLGQIWALADTDSDGKMNLCEFSIACKLINLKLRGFEIPKMLPPILLTSLTTVGGTPTRTPTGNLSPMDPIKNLANIMTTNVPPMIPPQPIPHAMIPPMTMPPAKIPPQIPPQPMMHSVPPMIPPQPQIISGLPQMAQTAPGGYAPMIQPIIQQNTQTAYVMQPLIPTGGISMMSNQPLISGIGIKPLIESSNLISPQNEMGVNLPAGPSPPSGTPSRSMSISERAPSIESPGVEWAVKGPAKLKYTQIFNQVDRNRTGFLTGTQARNLLLQSKLNHHLLAQIWALADMDSDGRLGCDEFVLAMYLCDMAVSGEKIPVTLPLEMIPPSFRKVSSRHASVVNSRHGSVSSQGTISHSVDQDPSAGLPQTTFEDKRKENFDKGQAELDRRRKTLADIQQKERQERERKEREEFEKREKARIDAEQKKQQEIERHQQMQREMEMEKEEQRKRALEQKESARKEMERQRQLEWEKQRISEMQQQRQREQESVLKLKAQNSTLTIDLGSLNEKVKDLSQKICDTRSGVTNVKTVIDGMRTTRDTQMSEMSQLKSKIKEQNQRLVQLSQDKAKMDAKNKMNPGADSQEQFNAAFSNKQLILKQLKDKLENTKEQIETKMGDITGNTDQLTDVKSQLTELINSCEELYSVYEMQRNQVLEMKNNRKNETYTAAWEETTNAWSQSVEEEDAVAVTQPTLKETVKSPVAQEGYVKYRALFEFEARNQDEISFQPGDVVMVPLEQNAEPGWLAGLINGHTGWFPETYVQIIENPSNATFTQPAAEILDNKRPLEGIAEVAEAPTAAVDTATYNGDGETYVACYPYESAEVGDLTFVAGETVFVSKKDGDWWTGTIGLRTGIFPSNYVTKPDADAPAVVPAIVPETIPTSTSSYESYADNSETFNGNTNTNVVSPLEDKKIVKPTTPNSYYEESENQAEVDSEVSQINYQPALNDVIQEYTRPMSTSSTTPSLRGKKGEVAQVIAPYEATSTEQLSLTRGQLIMIRKKTDSGWWEGELQAKGRRRQIGWFPATYVKILQGGRNSGRNTPVSGGRVEMSETIIDKVIALYPYKALNDDELSFEKDDIISVLGRDEPEWWRGELQGISGLFPSNYVGPFVTSGNV